MAQDRATPGDPGADQPTVEPTHRDVTRRPSTPIEFPEINLVPMTDEQLDEAAGLLAELLRLEHHHSRSPRP
jgi:hypothetical protein